MTFLSELTTLSHTMVRCPLCSRHTRRLVRFPDNGFRLERRDGVVPEEGCGACRSVLILNPLESHTSLPPGNRGLARNAGRRVPTPCMPTLWRSVSTRLRGS